MRSVLWTGVFALLMVELAIVLVLVLPVPRKIRNWIVIRVSKLELKKKLRVPLACLFVVLVLALADTTTYLAQIYRTEDDERQMEHQSGILNNPIDKHLLKEKEYRAGRNMYLVGFALTLLFVIGRITELMQEHAELEGELENLRFAVDFVNNPGGAPDTPETEGIEMKPMGDKKKD